MNSCNLCDVIKTVKVIWFTCNHPSKLQDDESKLVRERIDYSFTVFFWLQPQPSFFRLTIKSKEATYFEKTAIEL